MIKKGLLTILATLLILYPLVLALSKGSNIIKSVLCIGLGTILLLYTYSSKHAMLHKFLECVIVGIAAYLLLILPIRIWSGSISCAMEFFVAFALTYLFCCGGEKNGMKPVMSFYAVVISLLFWELPIRAWDFEGSLISFPGFLLYLLGAACAWIQFQRRNLLTWGTTFLFGIFSLFYAFKGFEYWGNKVIYGTFTGKVERTPLKDYQFLNEKGDTVRLSDWKGKKVLIDCWTKHCGYCYQAMPLVQRLHERYKGGDEVYVTSVFVVCRNEKKEEGAQIVKKEGFSFPVWSIDKTHELLSDLTITGYPCALLFDEDGCLIFHGSIEGAEELLKEREN